MHESAPRRSPRAVIRGSILTRAESPAATDFVKGMQRRITEGRIFFGKKKTEAHMAEYL